MNIFSMYHHSFAGGSKNTSRLLNHISQHDHTVDAYFFEMPQYFVYKQTNVRIHDLALTNVNSEVIDTQSLNNYSATDKIIQGLDAVADPILFGANLFPYCNILHDVKSQLINVKNDKCKLLIHPVGSDIWQVGTQMRSRVKWLLESPLVNSIITYSPGFVSEIKEYFNIESDINVLSPVLEKEKFFPIEEKEKAKRRENLSLRVDDFIIHHHSSMRKIKCPEIVLEIAIKSSQLINERCILLMVGPIPYDAITSLNLNLVKLSDHDLFIYVTTKGNLTIYWTGVLSDVEYLMQVSDVELNASIHDSFNISLMEAMACGIPVVTSDVVGISPHIKKASAGICFPTKKLKFDELNEVLALETSISYLFDIDYAVSAIVSFANDRIAAKIKGKDGAAYVINEFCIERITNEFYKLIS
jgi:glycosyltransferase involved in cell wall biosynthesis